MFKYLYHQKAYPSHTDYESEIVDLVNRYDKNKLIKKLSSEEGSCVDWLSNDLVNRIVIEEVNCRAEYEEEYIRIIEGSDEEYNSDDYSSE
jgi:hypothetical protein